MDVLLFGDQAVDVYPCLHEILFRQEHTTLLTSFLSHVTCALRTDISNLPALQRSGIPPLNDLLQFLKESHKSPRCIAPIANALLCISQLANLLRRV